MADTEEVVLLLDMQDGKFQGGMTSAAKAMDRLKNAGNASFNAVSDAAARSANSIKSTLGRLDFRGQIQDLSELGKKYLDLGRIVVDAASRQEGYAATFEQITGSTEAAKKELAVFEAIAKKSSFSVEDLVRSAGKSRAGGAGLEQTVKSLDQARDVAAFLREDLRDISNFLARGRRGDQEALTVLQERGIVSKEQLRKLGAQYDSGTGAIKAVTTEQKAALSKALDAGLQRFAGADEKRVKTFAGAISNMTDEATLAAAAIGKEMIPTLTSLTNWIEQTADAFQKATPATKAYVGQAVLIGGVAAALAVGVGAVAGPIGTVLGLVKNLTLATGALATSFLGLEAVWVAGEGGLIKIGSAMITVTTGTGRLATAISAMSTAWGVAAGAAQILLIPLAALAFETWRSAEAAEAADKAHTAHALALGKVTHALGGIANLGKVGAAELQKLGLTSEDVSGAIESLNAQLVDPSTTAAMKAEIRERLYQLSYLRGGITKLEKEAKPTGGASSAVDALNAQEDPFTRDVKDKESFQIVLKTLDAENASIQERINALRQVQKENGLIQRDRLFALEVEGKITDLVKQRTRDQENARKKEISSQVKTALTTGNTEEKGAKDLRQSAARLKEDSQTRVALEKQALELEQAATNKRVAALRVVLQQQNIAGDQRKAIEQKIFTLESKNQQARIKWIDEQTKKREEAAKKAEEASNKEAADYRDAQQEQLEIQGETLDRQIEQAKQRVDKGTGSQAEVEALIGQRQSVNEGLIKLHREDEDASAKSQRVRELLESNANQAIINSRNEARDSIKEYDQALRDSASTAQTTSAQQVAAVQAQVDGTRSALQSLDDMLKQQEGNFGLDAARKQADEIDARRKQKAAQGQANFAKANPNALRLLDEVDSRRAETLRAKQFADNTKAREALEAQFQQALQKQLAGIPGQDKLPVQPVRVSAAAAAAAAAKPVSVDAARVSAAAAKATATPVPVNVRVEVTVKDSGGRRLPQEGPAKITIGGRGSDYQAAATGMPFSSGGGLSSGVGLG